jgi:hypothetical protein
MRVELHQEIEASKAGNGCLLTGSVSPLLSGLCTNLVTYNHTALASLSSPSTVSFPLTPSVYLIGLLWFTVRHFLAL